MEYRESNEPCPVCVREIPLDDPRQQLGRVRWEIVPSFGRRGGKAVAFECTNGHSTTDGKQLKAWFPARDF